MSTERDVAAKTVSLLSREAAAECSPGTQPGETCRVEAEPHRGERIHRICRTSGAYASDYREPRADARGYVLPLLRGYDWMRFARSLGQL